MAYSLEHGGSAVAAEATRVACLVGGEEPGPLATWLRDQVPQLTEESTEPLNVIGQALAVGALIAWDLLDQCGADVDRAQSLIYLFTQDFCGLFQGVAMKRQWIKKSSGHSLFEGLD